MKKSAQKDAIIYALMGIIGYQWFDNYIPLIIAGLLVTSALLRSKLT